MNTFLVILFFLFVVVVVVVVVMFGLSATGITIPTRQQQLHQHLQTQVLRKSSAPFPTTTSP